jgi:hypothetical protein
VPDPVRPFYLDLAQWALDESERWAQWVAPCPVDAEEINQRKAAILFAGLGRA